jgi:hypothetical protein
MASLVGLLFGSLSSAQQPSALAARSLRWYASVADADQMPEARSFRIYGTPDQITLTLTTVNETARPIALNQAMFTSHVRFSALRTNAAVPVTAAWLPEAWWVRGALGPTAVLPNETFEVATNRGIEWRVVLRPTDGRPFVAGQYLVNIELSDEMASRSIIRGMQLAVLASPPRNDDERAAEYLFSGRNSLRKGQLLEARVYFQRALAANPATRGALFDLAVTHLRLKEYREAIAGFEQFLPVVERSPLPGYLAEAYVGVGDDGKASQILRQNGKSERDIVVELDRLRRRVGR